ncbi:MAG: HD domain-containing protein, partial [Ghiorsea sp.]|nr:HD domain-containing protein [Ghiorsea sp.]
NEKDRIILLFAALCHDFGKPQTTITNKNGKIYSPNHGKEGVMPSLAFLKRIGAPKWLKQAVEPLVSEHVAHFSGEATPRAVRRLAKRLEPMNIFLWEMLTEADACGRMPLPPSRPAFAWLECAQRLDVVLSRVKPLITGQVLLDWGMKASPRVGKVLKEAYEAQMDGKFHDRDSAYIWFLKYGVAIKL